MIARAFSCLFFLLSFSEAYVLSDEECLNYTIYPVQYELRIIPYLFENERFYYHCDLTITIIANAPDINVIELDAKDLEIEESIRVLDGNSNLINTYRPYEFDKGRGKLLIYLSEALRQYSVYKTQYQIKLSFIKYLNYDSDGVFVVKYDDGGPKYMISTRLSPNKAKYFFPCIDNPQFEAVYKFEVINNHIQNDLQYCNTSLVIAEEQRRYRQKDSEAIYYVPSPQAALHQVGFHLSQFGNRKVSGGRTNDTLLLWAPVNTLKYYTYILKKAENLLSHIQEYSGVNRPIVNGPINVVSVPKILDGYEIGSWNLLTVGDNRLAYNPEFTSSKQTYRMTFDLYQQICRIWLGNPGEYERTRWQEEWFKEGVASFLAYFFLAQSNKNKQGDHTPTNRNSIEIRNKAMSMDWHHSTPALATFNRTLAVEIPLRYKDLVMMKTASILWMVENWMGSRKFHQAFVKYINTRRGHYISIQDFMSQLDLDTVECQNDFFSGNTASKILNSWFHRPGYPVIDVQVLRDRSPSAVQLKQRQFSFSKENRGSSNYLIPISYVVQNRENCFNCYQPKFTIGSQSYTFEENLNGGWIILNRNASGYYRVNYDVITWKLIARSLREDYLNIDELNRAQIVNDIFALYVAGDIEHSLAVELLNYLEKERSPVVWQSAISGFDLLKTQGSSIAMTKTLYKEWQYFMRQQITGVYNHLASIQKYDENTRLFRSYIMEFACAIKYEPCLSSLKRVYQNHRYGKQNLNPDFREACYYTILSDTRGDISQRVNRFEEDDRVMAIHKMQQEEKFLYRIPIGSPARPIPILLSTTITPDKSFIKTTPTYEKHTTDRASSNMSTITFGALLLITILLVK